MDTMKALSVTRTWAWLLVHGFKDVENRTWYTNHRGPLLIHASKTNDREDWRRLQRWLQRRGVHVPDYDAIPFGAIVGQVTVFACDRTVSSDWHNPGQYGWYVRDAAPFHTPVPYRGRLQLFNVPLDAVPEART